MTRDQASALWVLYFLAYLRHYKLNPDGPRTSSARRHMNHLSACYKLKEPLRHGR